MFQFLVRFEKLLIGKIWMQPFYESLHRMSLRGMNYMQSQSIQHSGELVALTYAYSKKTTTSVIFDIGANVGDYLDAVCSVFKEDYKVYAFEPSQKLFVSLHKRFENNPKVSIFNIGLSDAPKDLKLYNAGNLYGTVYPTQRTNEIPELIKLEKLDDFCASHSISSIFYMKIDVEGAEIDVLNGAQKMLGNKSIQFIQFEFGPNCIVSKVYLKDFFTILNGYTIYRIVKTGLREIKNYHELLEIPLTSNFLAERKPLY